jgi:hypothetical protein
MAGLESRPRECGLTAMFLDTATNQPEAMAFYRALGYREIGWQTRPDWSWTLVYSVKPLPRPPRCNGCQQALAA